MFEKALSNEHGGALFMALFCTILVSVLGLTAYYVANTELTESSRKYEMAKALYLAEGGLERAILELQGGLSDGWDDEVAGLDGEAGTDDDGILSFGDQVDCYSYGTGDEYQRDATGIWDLYLGHYDVKIVDGRRPGESPGKCNRVVIGSDGISTQDFKRRVEAEVELWELKLPQALVYIDGRGMDTKLDGNAPFNVQDGKDTNPDGSPGPGPNVPAILVPGWQDVNAIKNTIGSNQCDQVLGVGNLYGDEPCDPSVTDLGTWNPNDFNPHRFRSRDLPKLESMVNNEIAGGTYAGQIFIGSEESYLITRSTGDLHISGQLYGYGVLIVEGDLVVTGQGEWHGLIITKDHARMAGVGSGFHLFGTILILDDSGVEGFSAFEWQFSGASSAAYSTETIRTIQDQVQTLVVNSWRQAPGL